MSIAVDAPTSTFVRVVHLTDSAARTFTEMVEFEGAATVIDEMSMADSISASGPLPTDAVVARGRVPSTDVASVYGHSSYRLVVDEGYQTISLWRQVDPATVAVVPERREMTMSNKFPFAGPARLASDPSLTYHDGGSVRTTFRVAVDDLRRNVEGGFDKTQTVFYDAVAFGKKAEMIAANFQSGDPIIVTGDLEASSYVDKEGKNRTGLEIKVAQIGPNPSLCDVTIDRSRRGQARPAPSHGIDQAQVGQSQQVEGPAF